jgi:hypothetical protein
MEAFSRRALGGGGGGINLTALIYLIAIAVILNTSEMKSCIFRGSQILCQSNLIAVEANLNVSEISNRFELHRLG